MQTAKRSTSDREVSSPYSRELKYSSTTAVRTLRSALWRTDPLALLAQHPELQQIVRATSDRTDALHARARALALLLELRAPIGGHLRQHWYVPGAVARLGAAGLLRIWQTSGVQPPSLRRLRDHLAALEDVFAIVEQPGEFVLTKKPTLREAGTGNRKGKPRRYPDTIHVLTEPKDREWWAGPGALVRRLHPEIRTDPRAWRARVGDWRRHRPIQGELFGVLGDALAREAKRSIEDTIRTSRQAADRLAALARRDDVHEQLLDELRAVGAEVRGRAGFELLGNPERARAAIALLSLALRRVKPPRHWGGFLVSAFRKAPQDELQAAKREVVG